MRELQIIESTLLDRTAKKTTKDMKPRSPVQVSTKRVLQVSEEDRKARWERLKQYLARRNAQSTQ